MSAREHQLELSAPRLLSVVGWVCFVLGVSTVLFSSLAYRPEHADFSIFNTYLSDIGDTAGWPQIIFNAGTILAAPVRYLVIFLVLFRLRQRGAPRWAFNAGMVVGAVSTTGTILMTATPFSVAPAIHKSGIGLYFLGVVILQSLIILAELRTADTPKMLPALSAAMVMIFVVFATLVFMYEAGTVGRNVPVFWEWMCFFTSMAWLLAHTILLGREALPERVLLPA